jgi:hypothetical protein
MCPAPRPAGIVPTLVLTFDTAAGTLANGDGLPDSDVSRVDFDDSPIANQVRPGGVPDLSGAIMTVNRSTSTHNVSIVRSGLPAGAELVTTLSLAEVRLRTVRSRRCTRIDQSSTALS